MPAAMFMDSNTEGQLHAMCHIVGARPRVRGSTGGRRASRANPKMPARAARKCALPTALFVPTLLALSQTYTK